VLSEKQFYPSYKSILRTYKYKSCIQNLTFLMAIPTPTRQAIVRMVCELNKPPKVVSEELGIKVDTVRKIARRFRSDGTVTIQKRGNPSPGKVTSEIAKFVKDKVDEDCTLTLSELKDKVQSHFHATLSPTTIWRILDGFKYTFKRLNMCTERASSEAVAQQRREYAVRLSQLLAYRERFYFVDETGFQV